MRGLVVVRHKAAVESGNQDKSRARGVSSLNDSINRASVSADDNLQEWARRSDLKFRRMKTSAAVSDIRNVGLWRQSLNAQRIKPRENFWDDEGAVRVGGRLTCSKPNLQI